jgi:glycine/D-amino acid oxidase-like deaminating enzyme/nitrite reductase/ring-hydroxylating ferredoxin subunit
MTETTSASESLWLDEPGSTTYPRIEQEQEFDVVVIGGGITGLTSALLLKRDGARVAVLEAERVGRGVTGCTTAKVTALQATVLSRIRERHGPETTHAYADASAAGVEQLAAIVEQESIACDLERRPAFTYAAETEELEALESEFHAASEAGLPVVFDADLDLPCPVAGAIRLDDQIQFHPVLYVEGLARAVQGEGSAVFEDSRVVRVDAGSPSRVHTTDAVLKASQVVVATHYPILDRGLYFARLKPGRSYCIAARIAGPPPEGMSIGAGQNPRSLRAAGDLLIVGGEGHAPGSPEAREARFRALEDFARSHWEVEGVTHRWSAQDPTSYDHLPMIGRYTPGSSRIFVATGFMKWGLSGGTFAAMLVRDLIGGRDNCWAPHFDPNRISLRSLPELVKMNSRTGAHLVGDQLRPAEVGSVEEIPPGEARTVGRGMAASGYFRDEDGALHGVSLRCTHMGCVLGFNAAERSWDCPCHGSRFDVDGAVLEGPAVRALKRREPEAS